MMVKYYKRILSVFALLLSLLTLFSCNHRLDLSDISEYLRNENIHNIELWRQINSSDRHNYLVFTDYESVFTFQRENLQDEFEIKIVPLVEVGSNLYTPATQWNDDSYWQQKWESLSTEQQDLYTGWENFRKESSWYYLLLSENDLLEGLYTSIQYREDELIKYRKIKLDTN